MSFDATCNSMVTLIREDHSGTITEISFCISPKMKSLIFDSFLPQKKESGSNELANNSERHYVTPFTEVKYGSITENNVCTVGKNLCDSSAEQ